MPSYMSEAEVNARALAEGPAEPTPAVFIMGAGVVGTALAARLVRSGVPVTGLHGRQIELSDAARAISGVMASNYVVALADMAQRLLVKAGVPQEQALPVLIPLLASVVQNLAQVGLPGALTGPVERGDVSSVEQHLRTLETRAPEALELYR